MSCTLVILLVGKYSKITIEYYAYFISLIKLLDRNLLSLNIRGRTETFAVPSAIGRMTLGDAIWKTKMVRNLKAPVRFSLKLEHFYSCLHPEYLQTTIQTKKYTPIPFAFSELQNRFHLGTGPRRNSRKWANEPLLGCSTPPTAQQWNFISHTDLSTHLWNQHSKIWTTHFHSHISRISSYSHIQPT